MLLQFNQAHIFITRPHAGLHLIASTTQIGITTTLSPCSVWFFSVPKPKAISHFKSNYFLFYKVQGINCLVFHEPLHLILVLPTTCSSHKRSFAISQFTQVHKNFTFFHFLLQLVIKWDLIQMTNILRKYKTQIFLKS